MKKLGELCTLIENNECCAIYKVKDNSVLDMIKLGCFEGVEDMIRIAKDSYNTITIFKKDGTSYSWERNTLVVESMKEKRRMIEALARANGLIR